MIIRKKLDHTQQIIFGGTPAEFLIWQSGLSLKDSFPNLSESQIRYLNGFNLKREEWEIHYYVDYNKDKKTGTD